MAPEILSGKAYDRGADVWAFGCTLYEAMSFKPPWAELCTPDGGIEGGMRGLQHALRTKSLDMEPLRSHYSENLRETLCKVLA